jgi:hypothetical protein
VHCLHAPVGHGVTSAAWTCNAATSSGSSLFWVTMIASSVNSISDRIAPVRSKKMSSVGSG